MAAEPATRKPDPRKAESVTSWMPAIVTVLVPALVFAFWCGSLSSDVKHLQTDVGEIRASLWNVQGMLFNMRAAGHPAEVLKELGAANQPIFLKALPALKEITEKPATEIHPDPPTLREVAAKLRSIPEGAADYWPIAFQFIQFATTSLNPDAPPPGQPEVVISRNQGFGVKMTVSRKVVVLDGGDIGDDIRFENCRIIFTGNPVRMSGVRFVNCVFEFPKATHPTPFLMQAGAQLLASNLQTALLTVRS